MPRASIALWGFAPFALGQNNDDWQVRKQGYEAAIKLGLLDSADYAAVTLYPFKKTLAEPGNIERQLRRIMSTVELIARRRDGSKVPPLPVLGEFVRNQCSPDEPFQAADPKYLQEQLLLLREYPSVSITVVWTASQVSQSPGRKHSNWDDDPTTCPGENSFNHLSHVEYLVGSNRAGTRCRHNGVEGMVGGSCLKSAPTCTDVSTKGAGIPFAGSLYDPEHLMAGACCVVADRHGVFVPSRSDTRMSVCGERAKDRETDRFRLRLPRIKRSNQGQDGNW
jgi:hypothetical protein